MHRVLRALWTVAAGLLVVTCGPGEPPAPAPPSVTVSSPIRREIQRYAEYTGTTRAIEQAEIRARVSGTLEKQLFESGGMVEAGDVLFEIERRTYQAAHQEAVANLASARATLARAQSDLGRIEEAIKSRAVSQSDLDLARATRDKAQAALLGAQAQLSEAAIQLGYTEVQTPVSGQVGRKLVDLGNLVGAGEPTLLTTVTRIQPIYVYLNDAERLVLRMLELQRDGALDDEDGFPVVVATASDEGFPHSGEIDFIDNTVDPTTGTIELRAVLPNEDRVLFPGLFVRTRLLGPSEEALLVNERAIGTDLGGKYLLVLDDENVVGQQYVTLGQVENDGFVVVDQGLDGSETYIVEGLLRARPGFPVTPEREGEPETAAPPAED
jgi:RND family efflux transporter MFP subunit